MKTKVVFFKQDNKWYADIPNHTLEENEMVMGSDTFLDLISAGRNKVVMYLTADEPTDSYMLHFKMLRHDDYGAYYSMDGALFNFYDELSSEHGDKYKMPEEIWICNVTHDVFEEHPNDIYLTNIFQRDKETEESINKEYDRKQCVYGEDSTMPCMVCSATCQERYEDFTQKGVKIVTIPVDGKNNGDT